MICRETHTHRFEREVVLVVARVLQHVAEREDLLLGVYLLEAQLQEEAVGSRLVERDVRVDEGEAREDFALYRPSEGHKKRMNFMA